jgi:SPP1 gp7 family putative phage head morphogenesis protein
MSEIPATPTEAEIEAAYLLLSEYGIPGDSPQMRALLEEQLSVAAGAAKTQTFAEFARQAGVMLDPRYSPVDQATVEWARTLSSELVRQVTDATRRGIAEVIAESLAELKGVPESARVVRSRLLADRLSKNMGMMAGLDANRIKAVLNYEESLLEAGYSAADAERMAGTFARRQLNDRAQVISQTEMRRAVESQRLEAEREAGSRDKRWMTVNDNRVSDQDAANQRQGWIKLDDNFQSGHAEPPGHPRCRCTMAYRRQPWEQVVADLRQRGVLAKGR